MDSLFNFFELVFGLVGLGFFTHGREYSLSIGEKGRKLNENSYEKFRPQSKVRVLFETLQNIQKYYHVPVKNANTSQKI